MSQPVLLSYVRQPSRILKESLPTFSIQQNMKRRSGNEMNVAQEVEYSTTGVPACMASGCQARTIFGEKVILGFTQGLLFRVYFRAI